MSFKKNLLEMVVGESSLTTYRIGVLQNAAYRELKRVTNETLREFTLSSGEWAVLGILSEYEEGVRISELAEEMMVEVPYVTDLVANLEKKKLLFVDKDDGDRRAKIVRVSGKGRELIPGIEDTLRKKMKYLMDDVSLFDLFAYVRTLIQIVKNART